MPELEEIMICLSEALLNLREDYPGREKANRSLGSLMSYLSYTSPKVTLVLDETTGLCKVVKSS